MSWSSVDPEAGITRATGTFASRTLRFVYACHALVAFLQVTCATYCISHRILLDIFNGMFFAPLRWSLPEYLVSHTFSYVRRVCGHS